MIISFLINVFSYVLIVFSKIDSEPLKIADIKQNIQVTEEKIIGKNGYHNDGIIYRKYLLNEKELKKIINDIKNNFHWKIGALNEELKNLISKADKNDMLNIDNGYYFYVDRHPEASGNIYEFNADIVYKRYSYNYTVMALDVNNKTLYYFQVDT